MPALYFKLIYVVKYFLIDIFVVKYFLIDIFVVCNGQDIKQLFYERKIVFFFLGKRGR